ncbi:MAG: EF-hand domain-containing protein [Fimbriimonas sp.]|nr:EF-hand domain-containing protein [Fimbriimonas sp.]
MNPSNLVLLASASALVCVAAAPRKIDPKAPEPGKVAPTFAKDIAPIIYAKCAPCHHSGEVAPFSLTSYEDARDKAPTIVNAVKSRYMPPWQAISHGEFRNERTLTDKQIALLEEWSKAGAPKGDFASAPKPPSYNRGWVIGTPDLVAKPPKAFEVSAEGADEYRCFVIPTHFPEGRYVTDVEVRPGNRNVVHHVLVYLDTSGVARRKDGKDGKPGYESFGGPGFIPAGSLGGWAPGLQAQDLPKGLGLWLPKDADIVIQVHYHKNGRPETDLSQIGMKFAQGPIDKRVRWESLDNELISIPAGDKRYEVTASLDLKAPVTLYDVVPHMHLLGHDMTVTATLPSGTNRQLIHVEPYDFNWQTRYAFKEPIDLPAGTHLSLVAHYDNSTDNPHNPNNPPKKVTFGEQTTNEMCFAFFTYTFDGEHLTKGMHVSDEMGLEASRVALTIERIFDHYDTNHDGRMDRDELADVIDFFQSVREEKGAKAENPKTAAQFLIAMYGKEQKGTLSKTEFTKMVRAFGK